MNPGSVQVRLGRALELLELNVEQQDMAGMSNFVDLIETYISVYFDDSDRKQLEKVPGFDWTLDETENWKRLNGRLQCLLRIAKDHNVFARAETAFGDASALEAES